jgi:PIN domain nuclease of toxin-antitoxin system
MNYILDTHTILWFFSGSEQLSKNALEIIKNKGNQKSISIVSIWEVAIKINIGKLQFEGGFDVFQNLIEKSGVQILPIEKQYIAETLKLPLIHRDPFDRMIISTAISENFIILTKDNEIHKYDVLHEW